MISIRPGVTPEEGHLIIEKVFNTITLRTESNEDIHICFRDSGFEFTYAGTEYSAKGGILETMAQNIARNKL